MEGQFMDDNVDCTEREGLMKMTMIVVESPPMRKGWAEIREYAAEQFPVLITGESGTGKGRFADALGSQ
jgi:transcriptional regulator with PAS, ATPase and Fis domain